MLAKKIGITTLVFLLMIAYFLPFFASAAYKGTATVNKNDFWSYKILGSDSTKVKISYTINVINGPAIDVFLFERNDYFEYKDNEPGLEYITEGSRLNITSANVEITVDGGRYYLVVDNTDKGLAIPPMDDLDNSVTFDYSINYSGDSLCVIAFIIGGVLIPGIIIIIIIMKYRKKDARLGPPYSDIFVLCSDREANPILQQVLSLNGFLIQWFSPMEGKAYRGTKKVNFFINLLPYYEITFKITPLSDGTSVIRLIKSFRGYHIGRARWYDKSQIDQKFMNTVDMLTNHFSSLGWFKERYFYRCGDKPEW
jgi:hypothetical protein